MPKIVLSQDECHCGLTELYDTIAEKLGYSQDGVYDCRKISVSKPVMEQVFAYFKEEEQMSRAEFNQLWLNFGPKANLPGEDYTADVDEGFILEAVP